MLVEELSSSLMQWHATRRLALRLEVNRALTQGISAAKSRPSFGQWLARSPAERSAAAMRNSVFDP
jgi:hypothetical protein